jgi:5'-3' exonuclease
MPAPLLVVDAPFLLYRSFFALPESITGVDDHPVNALLGAANLLLRAAIDRAPRAIITCFGAEAAHYRVELYPDYHAARPPVPEALAWQFEQAPAFFAGFGWDSRDSAGLEADDLLGSLALTEAAAGGRTEILTGDRDMYQCATESTSVLFLKAKSAGFEAVDPAEVQARYGVAPDVVPDFIALRGDPSDGLPGAPGIGAKTAADLLSRHGTLEATLAAAAGERPRIASSLAENSDLLRAFREIALLQTVELLRPEDRETDLAGGAEAARQIGIRRLAERLARASSLADL